MTNSKITKRALFASVLAMILCVAMLVGTTFAWFTDTAATAVNKIQAGTLDVDLEVAIAWNENGEPTRWDSIGDQPLSFRKAAGAAEDEDLLWEPGCTYRLPELRISNGGDLALKYKVVITGILGDSELKDAIVWTIKDGEDDYAVGAAHSLAVDESRIFTISGTMKPDAGNEYQGKSINGISITVQATQDTVETDSNNNQYDAGAAFPNTVFVAPGVVLADNSVYEISTAAGLQYVAQNFNTSDATRGKTFKLTADIDMSGINWTPWCNESQYFCGTFDGNGHTIKNLTINDTSVAAGHGSAFIGRVGQNGSGSNFVGNVTFENATVRGHHYVAVAVGYLEFGTVNNVKVVNSNVTATCVATPENDNPCGDKAGAVIGMTGPNPNMVFVQKCSASGCTVTAARDAAKVVGYGYAVNEFTDLSATNVTVTAVKGDCGASRAGIVSANALVGNGTAAGLAID